MKRKDEGRIYDHRMPRETKWYHEAQNASTINWRPTTMAGSTRVEPATMWNVPVRISRPPQPT